jgi:hypothetical protein
MSFHVNPQTGNPGVCRAKEGNCPFGAEAPHYDSKDAARAGYEAFKESLALVAKRKTESKLDSNGFLKPEWYSKIELHDLNCPNCEAPIKVTEVQKLISYDYAHCACGTEIDLDDLGVKITALNPSYRFLDKEEVRKATWYHSTDREDWLTTLDANEAFEAHVGTEDAAFDRALVEYAPHEAPAKSFYLYEVKLDPSVTIADELETDTNSRKMVKPEEDVTRYINRWEAPASISLAVSSAKLVIVGKRKVEVKEAHERLSVYNMPSSFPALEDR